MQNFLNKHLEPKTYGPEGAQVLIPDNTLGYCC